jgi:8-oxo-dGTP diphosphatase
MSNSARAAKSSPSTKSHDLPRPFTTVDLVIFTAKDGALQVLLVQRPTEGEES